MEKVWKTKVTEISNNKLVTYGINQCDIIRNFTIEEMVFLLIFGKVPSEIDALMLRSTITSYCGHGITAQSSIGVRMGADCGSGYLESVCAGFLIGFGQHHLGALELAMRDIKYLSQQPDLEKSIETKLSKKERIAGFGHRYHTCDPRAETLIKLCEENNYGGVYLETVKRIEEILFAKKGIKMNIDAACSAILLHMGFPSEIAPLITVLGRAPMLAADYMERLHEKNPPFPKLKVYDCDEE